MTDTHNASDRPGIRARIHETTNSFSLTGKIIFYTLVLIFAASALSLVWKVNSYFMIEVPARGGVIKEGVLGLPRYINPVLATTDGDKDLTSLVYSGLMRQTPSGELVPDLAESYKISEDGKIYTFIIKPNAVFHDGKPLTADDIVYTVEHVQNPALKSPRRAQWEGVVAEKIDERTVTFTLKEPYAPFLANTTLGILPKHAWINTTDETFLLDALNINPVGTGPYKIASIKKNGAGIPVSYTLETNTSFTLGSPLISKVVFVFFSTENALVDAFRSGSITSINSISPDQAADLARRNASIYQTSLPRVFGVFFNQTANDALAEHDVRRALDLSVDRKHIINTVLGGYGKPISGPMPQSFLTSTSTPDELIGEANSILDKAGWKLNQEGIREKKLKKGTTTLAFSISTSDAPELKYVAEIIKSEWKKIGADVTIKVFEGGYLNQNIIRPRKYDALLFGQIVNRDFDLYAFWHSSQRTDPSLNIALYNNPKADVSLENLRRLSNPTAERAEYEKFASEIASDIPAVFLYSPDFIYVTSPKIRNVSLTNIHTSSDRLNTLYTWYTNTDRVWKLFAPAQ